MSVNDLNAFDGTPPEPESSGRAPTSPSEPIRERSVPLADREVPLPTGQATVLMHQWLDGEASMAMLRATPGGNDAVDLWSKINDEAELLRSRTTPLYVHKRIMEALPDDMYHLTQPWYRRPVVLNPVTLLAATAALLGFGLLLAKITAH